MNRSEARTFKVDTVTPYSSIHSCVGVTSYKNTFDEQIKNLAAQSVSNNKEQIASGATDAFDSAFNSVAK